MIPTSVWIAVIALLGSVVRTGAFVPNTVNHHYGVSLPLLRTTTAFLSRSCSHGAHQRPTMRGTRVTSIPTALASTPWSRQAKVCKNDDDVPNLAVVVSTTETDLWSPRAWLEAHPPGVYTVLRCDFNDASNNALTVWGRDFHVERLRASWRMHSTTAQTALADQDNKGRREAHHHHHDDNDNDHMRHIATSETLAIMEELLKEAEQDLTTQRRQEDSSADQNQQQPSDSGSAVHVFMLTVLWYSNATTVNDSTSICVKGHVFTSGVATDPMQYAPNPLRVSLALQPTQTTNIPHQSQPLPHRQAAPLAKLSSWCSQRRPLEDAFQREGVGEVLLVGKEKGDHKDDNGSTVLLEGLTSNVFVLYPNNVLRTAAQGVLHGYARDRALACAEAVGLTVAQSPASLDDVPLWQEVFVTSSIKLIAPVDSVVQLVNDKAGNESCVTVWSQKDTRESESNSQQRAVWRQLYTEILKNQTSTY